MAEYFANVQVAAAPGSAAKPPEDWAHASAELVVVLDGATARTDTGCVHGVQWYAARLGTALLDLAGDPRAELVDALRGAIERVAGEHSTTCDLSHPGTPSAGVAILRPDGRYLVLGDVTIAADGSKGPVVVVDPRVEQTAKAERAEVDRHLIGTPEKAAALIPMKRAELAARNVAGGYWIAAADPSAATHALTGRISASGRVAVLTRRCRASRHAGPDGLVNTARRHHPRRSR
ncbi:hypothetical protein ACFQX7_08985 [Luedemannella flava]